MRSERTSARNVYCLQTCIDQNHDFPPGRRVREFRYAHEDGAENLRASSYAHGFLFM